MRLAPSSRIWAKSLAVCSGEAAALASQLQVEAFVAAEAAGWVALPADGSAVALPADGSAAVLPADDSAVVLRAAPGDSAAVLPVDDSAVGVAAAGEAAAGGG